MSVILNTKKPYDKVFLYFCYGPGHSAIVGPRLLIHPNVIHQQVHPDSLIQVAGHNNGQPHGQQPLPQEGLKRSKSKQTCPLSFFITFHNLRSNSSIFNIPLYLIPIPTPVTEASDGELPVKLISLLSLKTISIGSGISSVLQLFVLP